MRYFYDKVKSNYDKLNLSPMYKDVNTQNDTNIFA